MTKAEMQDLICRLLPYIEDIEKDKAYKPGAIRKLIREIHAAIVSEDAS